ncbi:hypothetical protein OAH12_01285 [Cyclobacteriaceae bacterium]|nr:hypothetical protein [Cyclobacteriaceae bacterium]
MTQKTNDIKQQLKDYKKKYYINELTKGVIFFLALSVTTFLVINFLEHLVRFPTTGRLVLLITFLGTFTYGSTKWILLPLYHLLNINKFLTDKEAAKQIGQYFPEIKDKLLNTLQLSTLQTSKGSLLEASILQKKQAFIGINFGKAVETDKNKKSFLKYLLLPLLLIIIVIGYKPSIVKNSSTRIIDYDNPEYNIPFKFIYQQLPTKVFANESEQLRVHLSSDIAVPQQCYVHINGKKTLMEKTSHGVFELEITPNEEQLSLKFEAAGYFSQTHQIPVISRPLLENISAEIEFPKYTNRKNTTIKNKGSFSVPEGSTVTLKTTSKNSNKITISYDKKDFDLSKHNHKKHSIKLNIKDNLKYELSLKNKDSKNRNKIVHEIIAIKDLYPTVRYQEFQDTILYKYLIIQGSTYDDYGISKLSFNYRIKKKGKTFKSRRIPIHNGVASQQFLYEVDLEELKLSNDQTLEYFLTIYDNDAINGPKKYTTPLSTYKTPNPDELKEKLDRETELTNEELKASSQQSKELSKKTKDFQDQLKTKKNLDYNDKKDISNLLDQHQQMEEQVEKLKNQFNQEQLQNDRFNENTPELQKKIDHLQQLLDQMTDPETKELIDQIKKENNVNNLQNQLDELNKSDQELQKELERTLELYKRLKTEQKLQENIDQLDQLAQKQLELEQKESTPKEQEELNKDFEAFQKQMKKLNKLNDELKRPMGLENFEQEQEDIEQDMKKAQDQLEKEDKQGGKESQKDAGKKMQEMAAKMKENQAGMEMEQMQEDLDNLRQISHNLLYLSHTQEELIKNFKSVQQKSPKFVELSQKQIHLNQSSKVVEDSLYALASRIFQIEDYITKELSDMKSYMSQSNEAIKARRRHSILTKQQYAMTSMNNLALMLDEVLDQMQQSMANSKPGQQMCQKPGGSGKGKGKKKKEGKGGGQQGPNLGDKQKQLNQQIQKLSNDQKEGRSISNQVAKSIARQQQIKQALKELLRENPNSQELQQKVRELEQLMDKSERDLLNKNISDQLIKRQQQINVKLLEAEKAAKQQEYDNKRESNSAQQLQRKYPPAFEEYLKSKQKQIELIETIPPSFTPYYKDEVNKYYERIK